MKHYLFALFTLLVFYSCKEKEKYPGYTDTGNGSYFKLLAIGESDTKPVKGDQLMIAMSCRTMNDSVFFDTRRTERSGYIFIPFEAASFKGSFEEHFATMGEGDSISFIISADSVMEHFLNVPLPVFLPKGSLLKANIGLKQILSEDEYLDVMERLDEELYNQDMEEQLKLNAFMMDHYPALQASEPGLYYIKLKEGKGPAPEPGKTLLVKYRGCFLDGRQFDDACYKKPLEFKLGEQQQVIAGLEKGIRLMKQGGKAKIILSSQLAFGENGSSTGVVPSYTSVVYEVELLKVN